MHPRIAHPHIDVNPLPSRICPTQAILSTCFEDLWVENSDMERLSPFALHCLSLSSITTQCLH